MKLTQQQVLVLLSKNRDVVRKAWELCDSIDEEWVMSDECPEGMCGVLQDLGQAVQDLDALLHAVETETEIGSGGHGLTMLMRQTATGTADFQSGLEEAIEKAVAENSEVRFEPTLTMGAVISTSKGHFSYSLKDKSGKHGTEYLHLIGTHWRHSGNLKVYTVREIVWIGDLDLWAISADGYGGIVQCVRTIDNFMGKRAGATRFTQIDPVTEEALAAVDPTCPASGQGCDYEDTRMGRMCKYCGGPETEPGKSPQATKAEVIKSVTDHPAKGSYGDLDYPAENHYDPSKRGFNPK